MSSIEQSKASGTGLTTAANPAASQQQLQQAPPKTRLGIVPSENIKEKQVSWGDKTNEKEEIKLIKLLCRRVVDTQKKTFSNDLRIQITYFNNIIIRRE